MVVEKCTDFTHRFLWGTKAHSHRGSDSRYAYCSKNGECLITAHNHYPTRPTDDRR